MTGMTEEHVKNLIMSNNSELKDSLFKPLMDLSNSLTRIDTKQENFFEFFKNTSNSVKENEKRIREMEPIMSSVALMEKLGENINAINQKLSKLEDVPKKLDSLVSKEEFSKTISDMKADIDKIKSDHEKNTELRKNMVFLTAFLLVVIPILMKGFDYISK